MIRRSRLQMVLIVCAAAVMLASPGAAGAGDELQAALKAKPTWNLEAAGSYAALGVFEGWGLGVRGGWAPMPNFQFGLAIETATLHTAGSFVYQYPSLPDRLVSYDQTFRSTLFAAYARLQPAFRYATPYAEVAVGGLLDITAEEHNTACSYGSGLGGALSGGVNVHPAPSVAAGLRAGVRNASWGGACTDVGGVWGGDRAKVIKVVSLTAGYRW